MRKEITINGSIYTFDHEFDVNLTLAYENDSWSEWHIIREFVSNALDSVSMNTEKVQITTIDGFVQIHDMGTGYPIVFAKRIGASSKKNDASTVGQFGEGSKLAMLTCIRIGIKVMIASQDWLIVPKAMEVDGQHVLIYDIYKSTSSIAGSLVIVEASEAVNRIINSLPQYFLHYSPSECLYGDINTGIFPLSDGKAKLYNKGVYIRDIEGIYSYAICIEKLNRDRDLINHSDIAYQVRDIWENVNNKELIMHLLKANAIPYSQRNKLVEFYASMYSNYPEVWATAFKDLFGENACLYTDDIAEREAKCLGFKVVRMEYNFASILKKGGIRYDSEGLSEDFAFTFAAGLDKNEKLILSRLPVLAELAGFEVPNSIRVFDEYKHNADIPGLYDNQKEQIYLHRDILKSDLKDSLHVFLHEACHHTTKTDDISREFAEGLCKRLTEIVIKYVTEIGVRVNLLVSAKGLELPEEVSLSSSKLSATVALIANELTIRVGATTIKAVLESDFEKPILCKRKVLISNGRFVVSLPDSIKAILSEPCIECSMRESGI